MPTNNFLKCSNRKQWCDISTTTVTVLLQLMFGTLYNTLLTLSTNLSILSHIVLYIMSLVIEFKLNIFEDEDDISASSKPPK